MMDPPPSELPPPAAERRRTWLPSRLDALRPWMVSTVGTGAGLLVLAVIPLFISFSSTQIKSLFEQFTGGCVLVLDKAPAPYGQLYVTGRIAGTMPDKIPLVFAGRDANLNTIDFDDAYRLDQIADPNDLTFHPMINKGCPGELCPALGPEILGDVVQITLTDLRPEFTYRFRIRVVPYDKNVQLSPAHLKVYAHYDTGFNGQVCRVEPRRWFNFWVWATPLAKAGLFILVIVFGGLLLKAAKNVEGRQT